MDTASQNRLSKVHPELAKRVAAVIADLARLDVRVVQGIRTYAEQDKLYAQGRTTKGEVVTNARGGFSNHNFGLAVDLCPFVGGKADWNNIAAFNAIGASAASHGLAWGGAWKKFIDKPHVELPTGLTTAQCRQLRSSSGDLSKLWARASQIIGSAVDASPVSDPSGSHPNDKGDEAQAASQGKSATAQPPILKRGSKGRDVTVLQDALVKKGYKLDPDGAFGEHTTRAVRDFQRKNKLTVDGMVGPKTRKALGLK